MVLERNALYMIEEQLRVILPDAAVARNARVAQIEHEECPVVAQGQSVGSVKFL